MRGIRGRPGPAIYFDSSEEILTIKGEKVRLMTKTVLLERLACLFASRWKDLGVCVFFFLFFFFFEYLYLKYCYD